MTKKKMTSTTDPVGTTGDAPALVHADPVGPSPRVVGILSNTGLNQTKTNVMSDVVNQGISKPSPAVGTRSNLGPTPPKPASIMTWPHPPTLRSPCSWARRPTTAQIVHLKYTFTPCIIILFEVFVLVSSLKILLNQQDKPQPMPWTLLHPVVKLQQVKESHLCTSQTVKTITSRSATFPTPRLIPRGLADENANRMMCEINISQQTEPQPTPWILFHLVAEKLTKGLIHFCVGFLHLYRVSTENLNHCGLEYTFYCNFHPEKRSNDTFWLNPRTKGFIHLRVGFLHLYWMSIKNLNQSGLRYTFYSDFSLKSCSNNTSWLIPHGLEDNLTQKCR